MDPLRTEQGFQELRGVLAGSASARWRLMALAAFLDEIDIVDPSTEAYLLELADPLSALMQRLDPAGLDPEACARITSRFEQIVSLHPELGEIENLALVLRALRAATAACYAYVGEATATLDMLAPEAQHEDAGWLETTAGTPLERLEQAARQARMHHFPATTALDNIVTAWKGRLRPVPNSAVVTVAESTLPGASTERRIGGLRQVQLDLYGERPGRDDVTADVTVFGAEDESNETLSVPLRAARALLAETVPSVARRYVAGRVRFSEAGKLHAGRSSDLAVAAVFYGALLRHAGQRRRYDVTPGAAFTGALDEEGTVLPVDNQSLEIKVRAAFFSWVTCLAVPKAQWPRAEAIYQALATDYPARRLDVVGIGHLREVFYDRRLTDLHVMGVAPFAARWAWRRKFSVGGLATILVLLLVIGRLLYGPIDRQPVAGEIVGEVLHLKNAEDQVVGKLHLGPDAAAKYHTAHRTNQRLYDFVDIDGDGTDEVIWAAWDANETDQTRAIVCTSISGKTVYWSTPLHFPMDFPGRPDIKDGSYQIFGLSTGDLDGDGDVELIAVLNHRHYFPGIVARYDAATGVLEEYYLNEGWLFTMTLVDLDEDGIVEIVAAGTNSAFNREAVMVVLDPRYVSGHGPTRGSYVPGNLEPARERVYIRIPKSEMGEVQRIEAPDKVISDLFLRPGQIIARYYELDIQGAKNTYLLLHFDHRMAPLTVGMSSQYDMAARQFYEEGHITKVPDTAYWEAYMQQFAYWDGEAWQNEPVMNRRYLEAIARNTATVHPD